MVRFPPASEPRRPESVGALVGPRAADATDTRRDSMAKQNSATDPISAAMSAIESALNLTDDDLLAVGAAEKATPAPAAASARSAASMPFLKPSAPSLEPTPLLRPGPPPPPPISESEPKPAIP